MGWIRTLILLSASIGIVAAQQPGAPTLQLGTPIERTIGPGQTHTYEITAAENSYVQITIDQRGIDLVIHVHDPSGKKIGAYDSPNGNDGPEDVSFVTTAKVPYRIQVTPLSGEPEVRAGRYVIELNELRQATDEEIKESRNHEILKARGIALLGDLEGLITELRLPQTRIKAQIQVAQMLWESDEKQALKYLTDAVTSFKEMYSNLDPEDTRYIQNYHLIANLRHELVSALTARQPEMALNLIRSTPPLADPYGNQRDQMSQEAVLEIEIANQIANTNPKRTLEIARQSLKTRFSSNLGNTISQLRQQNYEMAAELANEIASKLLSGKLLTDSQAGSLLFNLIQLSNPNANYDGETNGSTKRPPLLSEQQRRDLLQKAMNEALAYKPAAPNTYSPERDAAWSLLHGLKSMGAELETVNNGSAAAIEKKLKEMNANGNPRMAALQELHETVNNPNTPLDEVIQTLSRAPKEHKDQLFINLANRLANNGDIARAKQLVNDYVTSPYQRHQALYSLESQEMYRAISKGKVEEALRSIANISNLSERAQMLSQLANQMGQGHKRAAALNFLEQARGLLPQSVQAQDHSQMGALFEIAKAFSRYDSKRAFEILDPLVDQFNEISAAARTLNGFGGEYFDQEELNLQNGNSIASIASQMNSTIATLGLTNFNRAKVTAERIRLPEVRLRAYLDIAQQAIQNSR